MRSAVSQIGSSSFPSRCGGALARRQVANFLAGGASAGLSSHSSIAAHWRQGSVSGSCRSERKNRLAGLAKPSWRWAVTSAKRTAGSA